MSDDQTLPRPDLGEIATSGDGADFGFGLVGELLQSRDEVLTGRGGGDLRIYELLRRDDQVKATWQQRTSAAISREWYVEPGGPTALDAAAAEDMKQQLKDIRFDRVCEKMLSGIFYGFSVGECLYRAEGGKIRLGAIKVRRARRFRFDREMRLRLLRPDRPTGEVMPPNKFWVFSVSEDDDDNPYGVGLAYWLYWPIWMKRNGLRFWSLFLEKFALPTTKGTIPRGASLEERRKLLSALRAITRDSALVLPEGVDVTLIESIRQSGGDFAVFYNAMDAAISKIILSQTLTTDNGGSRAQGEVHKSVMLMVVKRDNDLLCESLNDGPARWLTAWNFPGAATPVIWRDHAEPEDLEARSKRDQGIRALGYKPSQDYIDGTYGPGWTPDDGNPPPPAPPASDTSTSDFAEPGPAAKDAVDELTGQVTPVAAPPMNAMVEQIRTIIDGAATLDEVPGLLLAKYGEVGINDLASVIGEAMVLADLHGRQDLTDGG